MPKIQFKKDIQIKFFNDVKKELKLSNWAELAKLLDVHYRSLSDWRRGKYTLPEKVFKKCIKLVGERIKVPSYNILPDFWHIPKAAKKGGLVRFQRYGNLGTPEGRKKGGKISQENRRLHPELYQHCNLRKIVHKPNNSKKLAEFFGIILGDGRISSGQVGVALNSIDAKEYKYFVANFFKELFKITPFIYKYKNANCVEVIASGVDLVEFLLTKGLKIGNKVKHQIDVPVWIKKHPEFAKYCLRGLVDTDGCVYSHDHKCNSDKYFNIGLEFSNRSVPLLNFVNNTLSDLDFHPKFSRKGVNLYRESEVCRYAKEISFDNVHHSNRLNRFLEMKSKRRGG